MTLYDLLAETGEAALLLQDPASGSMPGGHNGPYRHPETPVRNTGHWMITWLKAHSITRDGRFLDAAHRALTYVTGPAARPHGKTFWHRQNPELDRCNGLIGQAWTIEALLAAADAFVRPDLVQLCEDHFLLHPFDEERGVWFPVDIDGSVLPLDTTFNHQLWFAAAGALMGAQRGGEVRRRVQCFLDRLPGSLSLYPNGLIWHPLACAASLRDRAAFAVQRFREITKAGHDRYEKAVGYHAFNLYGFALVRRFHGDHPFWSGRTFRRIWDHAATERFRRSLDTNRYGYPYNPPGIEMAFALEVFGGDDRRKSQETWMAEQVCRCYDREARMMHKGTADQATYAARIYEATRLPDLTVA